MGKHNTLIGTELINLKIEFEAFKNYAPNKRLRQIRNARHFWFHSALVFTAQWLR